MRGVFGSYKRDPIAPSLRPWLGLILGFTVALARLYRSSVFRFSVTSDMYVCYVCMYIKRADNKYDVGTNKNKKSLPTIVDR